MSSDWAVLPTGPHGGGFRRLTPEARTAWQVENLVGTAAAAAVATVAANLPFVPVSWRGWGLVAFGLVVAVGSVEAFVVIPRRHATYRYALLDSCIVVVRGRVWARERVFPLHQVLYVETQRGPVLRHLGLAMVRIGTIAEPHSVGPVPEAVAEELRRAVDARVVSG